MPLDVIMPALGMAQDTGKIVGWQKQPGDPVVKGDVLFEVETDKATMEVEAQGDGYLTDVTASDGADVPVGHVIAKISDTAQTMPPPPVSDTPPGDHDLPPGKDVIMPTLGMAQDTGLLVAWHKTPGDSVGADDVLFEVETDKSTVEVNAGLNGYLAAVLAAPGDDVPVGQTIAIISPQPPANTVTRGAGTPPAQSPPPTPVQVPPPKPAPALAQHAASGRILASPKMRRLAREQGLDLARLVAAGHPQPFHVKDLETLIALGTTASTAPAPVSSAGRLTADIPSEGFSAFASWAAKTANLTDSAALLAGLCAASLGKTTTIAVETFGVVKTYAGAAKLSATAFSDNTPELRIRDLRFSSIATVQMGPEDVPVLTLTRQGTGVSITLEYAQAQLSPPAAIALLSNFAGRMEHPIRHLL